MTSQSIGTDMNTELRTLCADLAGHLAYMHAQMEEGNKYSELEDYYWYRESVRLLTRARIVLAEPPTTT